MLPSLLRAWPGSAGSTKHGVDCSLWGLLTSQLVVPVLSTRHGTECAQIHTTVCVYVCKAVHVVFVFSAFL